MDFGVMHLFQPSCVEFSRINYLVWKPIMQKMSCASSLALFGGSGCFCLLWNVGCMCSLQTRSKDELLLVAKQEILSIPIYTYLDKADALLGSKSAPNLWYDKDIHVNVMINPRAGKGLLSNKLAAQASRCACLFTAPSDKWVT